MNEIVRALSQEVVLVYWEALLFTFVAMFLGGLVAIIMMVGRRIS